MDHLKDAFAALLPRINMVAAALHRRWSVSGRPSLADARQQAALIVWQKLATHAAADVISALYRDLFDWFRSETHYRAKVVVQHQSEVPSPLTWFGPLDSVAELDFAAAIRSRITSLPPRFRSVVRQKAAGAKIRDIAAALGVSDSRASQLLSEAAAWIRDNPSWRSLMAEAS